MSLVKETTNDLLRIATEDSVDYVVPSMRPEPDTPFWLMRNGQILVEGADYSSPESPAQWFWRIPLLSSAGTDVFELDYYPFGRRA